jgi:hypothetical protein
MGFLATVGDRPVLRPVRTVWGIMNSFIGISGLAVAAE